MMLIVDAHCDAPTQMVRHRNFNLDNPGVQVDFPKMQRGGVGASFFALYIPSDLKGSDATDCARLQLAEVKRQVAESEGRAVLARSAAEVRRNQAEGKLSILLGIENASALDANMHLLQEFYDEGVRYITLTHSEDNDVCDSCTGQGRWGGLSPFGRMLVKEMNDLDMLIDLAHTSDRTIMDVLSLSDRPVVDTHTCCRSICQHKRNLSDELIKGIAASGGVVGISIYPPFLSSQACPGVETVLDHIRLAIKLAGEESVCLGSDFDGIEVTALGLESIDKLPDLFSAMRLDGIDESVVRAVAGENLLRLL